MHFHCKLIFIMFSISFIQLLFEVSLIFTVHLWTAFPGISLMAWAKFWIPALDSI